MQVRARLEVNEDGVGSGTGERLDVLLGLDDHEVDVEGKLRHLAHRFDHDGPDGDVGHEPAVHHVDVDDVRARLLDRPNLFRKPTKIGRQDGGCDSHTAHARHLPCYSPKGIARAAQIFDLRRVVDTRRISKQDFDRIVEVIDHWWGGPISTFAHPIFFYELGDMALVVEHEGTMIGFLLGFVSHDERRTGYIHLVGIHPDHRRKGVGRLLYSRFTEAALAAGCTRLKAITTTGSTRLAPVPSPAQGWQAQEADDYAPAQVAPAHRSSPREIAS